MSRFIAVIMLALPTPGANAQPVYSLVLANGRATYEKPMQYSTGIVHVLISRHFVVEDGQHVEKVFCGKPIRLGDCTEPSRYNWFS